MPQNNNPLYQRALKSIRRNQIVCALLFLPMAAGCWYSAQIERPPDGAGAFVDDGKIQLIAHGQSEAEMAGIFDHELTHLFGKGRFNKIGRDGWLAYAYPVVLAMERGGPGMLPKSRLSGGFGRRLMMHFFYEGVMGAAIFHDNPEQAEDFVLRDVSERIGSVNPDSDTDNPDQNPAFEANWASAVGLAGVAWMTASGDADTALLYLDDRGRGMTPSATLQDIKIRAPQHINHDNTGMVALIVEARHSMFGKPVVKEDKE